MSNEFNISIGLKAAYRRSAYPNSHTSFGGAGMSFSVARVTYVLLDNSDKEKFDKLGGWPAIGTIECQPFVNNENINGITIVAKPINQNITRYPVVNEIVMLTRTVGYQAQSPLNNYIPEYYYTNIINGWNTVEHNATPSRLFFEYNNDNVTSKFNEKGNTLSLVKAPGDITIEGRSPNSLRFGSTIEGFKTEVQGLDRSPYVVLSNNRYSSGSKNTGSFENINVDGSSLYMLSGHNLNFKFGSFNFDSYNQLLSKKQNNVVPIKTIDNNDTNINKKDQDILPEEDEKVENIDVDTEGLLAVDTYEIVDIEIPDEEYPGGLLKTGDILDEQYEFTDDVWQEGGLTIVEEATEQEIKDASKTPTTTSTDSPEIKSTTPDGKWFRWPLDKKVITSKYGPRKAPVAGASTFHGGIDLAAKVGTPVYATMSGTIIEAGVIGRGGKSIVISHPNGYLTGYAHLSQYKVKVGQKVSVGDIIALSGNTGTSSGPHLHHTVKKKGHKLGIDPQKFYVDGSAPPPGTFSTPTSPTTPASSSKTSTTAPIGTPAPVKSYSALPSNVANNPGYKKFVSDPKVVKRTNEICAELGINPIDLYIVMYAESKFDTKARNWKSKTQATGLIQFTKSTAIDLGTTVDAIYNMNALQQLEYVRKYFLPKKGMLKNVYELYSHTFVPISVGKPMNWVFTWKKKGKVVTPEEVSKENTPIAKAAGKRPGDPLTRNDFYKYINALLDSKL